MSLTLMNISDQCLKREGFRIMSLHSKGIEEIYETDSILTHNYP